MSQFCKNQWVYAPYSHEEAAELSKEAGIPLMLAAILINRGIKDVDSVKSFLNPSLNDLHDPFLLKDMAIAVEKIIEAVHENKKIVIYGDYDVDGVTSTALIYSFLSSVGADVYFYIPDRLDEGYGLSEATVEKIISCGAELVITVDCGITSFEEVKSIKKNNIDIIITDHHECKAEIPEADAVINPHRCDCTYPFRELAGVGVAFKLVSALCTAMRLGDICFDYLELVALGTVADVVPLLDENRILVKHGIERIRKTANKGLKALIENSGVNKEINSWIIGFVLAPRINAAGRIGYAGRAVRLLVTDDQEEAIRIAKELNDENRYRQDTELEILNEALDIIRTSIDLDREKVIIVSGEAWHHGVIGIVASKITDMFYRPCIMLSNEGGVSKGSARSIKGFNIFEALCHCGGLLDKFGGHELAAGLTIATERVPEFKTAINRYAEAVMKQDDLVPKIMIDYILQNNDISVENIKKIDILAPFGPGNPSPIFAYHGLRLDKKRSVGENKHLKLLLKDKDLLVDAIGFNMGDRFDRFLQDDLVDVACSLEVNTWNQLDRVQLNIKDIRINDCTNLEDRYYKSLYGCFDPAGLEPAFDGFSHLEGIKKDTGETGVTKFINDCMKERKKVLILTNCLKSTAILCEILKNSMPLLNYSYGICYTYLNDDSFDKAVKILVNPGKDFALPDDDSGIIFYGDWLDCKNLIRIAKDAYKKHAIQIDLSFGACTEISALVPERKDLAAVYQYIRHKFNTRANLNESLIIEDLSSAAVSVSSACKVEMNYFKIKKSIEIFKELGLLEAYDYCEYGTVVNNIKTGGKNAKADLAVSLIYREMQEYKSKLYYINNRINKGGFINGFKIETQTCDELS